MKIETKYFEHLDLLCVYDSDQQPDSYQPACDNGHIMVEKLNGKIIGFEINGISHLNLHNWFNRQYPSEELTCVPPELIREMDFWLIKKHKLSYKETNNNLVHQLTNGIIEQCWGLPPTITILWSDNGN